MPRRRRDPDAPAPSAGPTEGPAEGPNEGSAGGEGAGIRLNKLLADHGIASRRHADQMIADGKVMIDGDIVTTLGTRVDPDRQRVEVDGVVLRGDTGPRRYYLLNKPSGVVCTNEVREARPRAVDLIGDPRKGRIYSVGRLDEETVGLLILTNDGEFANRVSHPRYGVSKTYLVKIDGRVSDAALQRIREGVHLSEGRTGGARIVVRRRTDRQSTLLVTLNEGRNREVRRIFARVGWNVRSLRRTRIGHLSDRGLKVGNWRPLSRVEVRELLEIAGGDGEDGASPRGPKRRAKSGSGVRRPRPFGGRSGRGRGGAKPPRDA